MKNNKIKINLKNRDQSVSTTRKIKIVLKNSDRNSNSINNQLNDYLDQNYLHHLLSMKNSWSEVKYKIRLDCAQTECWWDLELLLLHFTEQLNASTMSNPSPQWPSNPFNRIYFSIVELTELEKKIKQYNMPVNYMIKKLFHFIHSHSHFQPPNPNQTTNYSFSHTFSQTFIKYVSRRYRFRLINLTDSQSNYVGYWVKRPEPLSEFERMYAEFIKIPPYEIISNTSLFERGDYIWYKTRLNSIPKEEIDFAQTALEFI